MSSITFCLYITIQNTIALLICVVYSNSISIVKSVLNIIIYKMKPLKVTIMEIFMIIFMMKIALLDFLYNNNA